MFLPNAQSHFLFIIAIQHPEADADKKAKVMFYAALLGYWVLAYGVFAVAAVLETVFVSYLARPRSESSAPRKLPTWYRALRGIVAHVTLRAAAYAVIYGVLDMDMYDFL